MERLLRETGVRAGLLFNGLGLRLISAPRGESSGWMDLKTADMVQTPGRPICTALRLLLSQSRLLSLPRSQRLAALLEDSRKYQNEVGEQLAEQVLHALYELLRGFQAAHDASSGELLRSPLDEHPDEIYRGLLSVILRLVFLLYAEERDMLTDDETFVRHYSLAGLHERLRKDAALYPDTMDQRYGAWAQLLVLFRILFDGAEGGSMSLPRRHGALFDPGRFPFLEGRPSASVLRTGDRVDVPLVPDGTVYRALENLLVLGGERISYRALDVEQIGSVYETMMGFRLERATGQSIAIRAPKKRGAPSAVDLEVLLAEAPSNRRKWVDSQTLRKLTDPVAKAVGEAATLEDLHAALNPVIDHHATPDLVPTGTMILQPSEERRRSGSHYTPRALTESIVCTTLGPVLARLRRAGGGPPRPSEILDLKVCDPAMGSGAFLVEACRYLGDSLVDAWHAHNEVPAIPPDEDEAIFARRLVAQRCLYGVDRNPVAVDLAKVSLWLVTLAKDHALTFLDHALRHGDSLVGLSREQVESFHWDLEAPSFQAGFEVMRVREHMEEIVQVRKRIREADDNVADVEVRELWDHGQSELSKVRLFGDLVVSSFFEGATSKERESKRSWYAVSVVKGEGERHRDSLALRRQAEKPMAPLHWEFEYPEVFAGEDGGFDAIVGNPPFAGVTTLAESNVDQYTVWLRETWPGSGGKCDLVAFFFRRSFDLLNSHGCLGLLATNTVANGDTRESGLAQICDLRGVIYSATKRIPWPGAAAVIASAVHLTKEDVGADARLDGKLVPRISAFLLPGDTDHAPPSITPAIRGVTKGVVPYGEGFVIADGPRNIPGATIDQLLDEEPAAAQFVMPYLGGKAFNSSPTTAPNARIVDFRGCELSDLTQAPRLLSLVEEFVKPGRDALSHQSGAKKLKERWWRYQYEARDLFDEIRESEPSRVIAVARVTPHLSFSFVSPELVFNEQVVVFPEENASALCILQSNIHDSWARFLTGVRKDDFRYSPTDCFNTFAFPEGWRAHPTLEAAGEKYQQFRASLMVRNDEGLTRTYNRFHDPSERDPEIEALRELHVAMDRAVLDAYGWSNIPSDYEFLLDYEIDEEEWGNKKRPYRFRWPDEVRDRVISLLLELNAERVSDEVTSGAMATEKRGSATARREPNEPRSGVLL